jgi:hypothetical protein
MYLDQPKNLRELGYNKLLKWVIDIRIPGGREMGYKIFKIIILLAVIGVFTFLTLNELNFIRHYQSSQCLILNKKIEPFGNDYSFIGKLAVQYQMDGEVKTGDISLNMVAGKDKIEEELSHYNINSVYACWYHNTTFDVDFTKPTFKLWYVLVELSIILLLIFWYLVFPIISLRWNFNFYKPLILRDAPKEVRVSSAVAKYRFYLKNLGIATAILGGFLFVLTVQHYLARSIHTQGVVLQSVISPGTTSRNGTTPSVCHVTVQYQVGRGVYHLNDSYDLTFNVSCPVSGDGVMISYNANDPTDASIKNRFEMFFMPLTIIGIAVFCWILRYLIGIAKI